MCKDFKCITLLVEMLILDVENASIPTSKQKEFIHDLIDVIPEKYLLHLCPIRDWFQLACTPDDIIFNRKSGDIILFSESKLLPNLFSCADISSSSSYFGPLS